MTPPPLTSWHYSRPTTLRLSWLEWHHKNATVLVPIMAPRNISRPLPLSLPQAEHHKESYGFGANCVTTAYLQAIALGKRYGLGANNGTTAYTQVTSLDPTTDGVSPENATVLVPIMELRNIYRPLHQKSAMILVSILASQHISRSTSLCLPQE